MSHSCPSLPRPRKTIILAGLGLYLLLPVTLSALQRKPSVARPAATPASSPTPEPSPPVIEFQAIADRDNIGPDDQINITLNVANKSSKPIAKLQLNFADSSFDVISKPSLPASLPAYRSATDRVIIKPSRNSTAGAHKVLVSLQYTWNTGAGEFISEQSTTLSITLARRFEEETKGFPGGTAGFFYLLLPILPAMLSYQFFDKLRKGEGATWPEFKTEHLVPAFFVGVVLSLLLLVIFKLTSGFNYSNPTVILEVVFGSAIAGAAVPLGRWGLHARQNVEQDVERKVWTFTAADSLETYLRKALLAPTSPAQFVWATGTVDNRKWTGVPLTQPDGSIVLGPKLQVSYPKPPSVDEWQALLQVVDENGVLRDRARLVEMVQAGKLNLDFAHTVTCDGNPFEGIVAIDEVKNWKRAESESSPLVVPSS